MTAESEGYVFVLQDRHDRFDLMPFSIARTWREEMGLDVAMYATYDAVELLKKDTLVEYPAIREAVDETTVGNWQEIGRRDELVPGDLLATHAQPAQAYHVVFNCGQVGGRDLVYDSSPRGRIPLFDGRGRVVADRPIHTRYARATETTDRLRDDGGAYLRLWDERMRFFHTGLHARLVAGGAVIKTQVEDDPNQ